MKRCLRTSAVYLGLGLVAALVVAWACSLWAPLGATRALDLEEARAVLMREAGGAEPVGAPLGLEHRGAGWRLIFAVDPGSPDSLLVDRPVRRAAGTAKRGAGTSPPFQQMPPKVDSRLVQILRAGWPADCLGGRIVKDARAQRSYGATRPPSMLTDHLGVARQRRLPLRPRWGGLALNAATFAAAAWLLVPGPIVLRRFLRGRRGLCRGCGYDLGHALHDACPECGAAC